MDENIGKKLQNIKEWNSERAMVKPFIDMAVESHNSARVEARWHNYEKAEHLYKEAIKNYRNAVNQNPKYYLQDLLDRIEHVLEEYTNTVFNLKTSGYKLKDEKGIRDFVVFMDSLKSEEKRHLDSYDIARVFLSIGDFYYYEAKDAAKAYEFYNRVKDADCERPFINREAFFKMGKILFDQQRFKEAVVDFVLVLSYDRDSKEVIAFLDKCLEKLKISEHRSEFLTATPLQAKKLIMEVL